MGTVLIEIGNISEKFARKILKDASYRLPIKVMYVRREVNRILDKR
jgi:ribosomal protein L16/L10AE